MTVPYSNPADTLPAQMRDLVGLQNLGRFFLNEITMIRVKPFLQFFVLLSILTLGACATLPNVSETITPGTDQRGTSSNSFGQRTAIPQTE